VCFEHGHHLGHGRLRIAHHKNTLRRRHAPGRSSSPAPGFEGVASSIR
jgi:hypothetical protein